MGPRPDPPTPEDDRIFEIEQGLQREKARFFKAVHDGKPFVDYIAMLGIQAAAVALLGIIVGRAAAYNEISERGIFGAALLCFLWWRVFKFIIVAADAQGAIILIKLAQWLRLPYPFHESRSATMRLLLDSVAILLAGVIMTANAVVGQQFAQRVIDSMKQDIETASVPDPKPRRQAHESSRETVPVPIAPGRLN